MKTREIDIRKYLHSKILKEHENLKNAKIIDELKLCQGDAIIDVAVFNGCINGYEIKSDSDTLERLPKQIEIYNKIFHKMTIVTGEKHIDKVSKMIPDWWGIIEVINGKNKIKSFSEIKNNGKNNNLEAISLLQLLWKDEIIEFLTSLGIKSGIKNKPKRALWDMIAYNTKIDCIEKFVITKIKSRKGWRVD